MMKFLLFALIPVFGFAQNKVIKSASFFSDFGFYNQDQGYMIGRSDSLFKTSKNLFEILVFPIDGPKGLMFFIVRLSILKVN